MVKIGPRLGLLAALLTSTGAPVSAQQLAAQAFPAEVRGQVEDTDGAARCWRRRPRPPRPAAPSVVGAGEELGRARAMEARLLAPSVRVAVAAAVSGGHRASASASTPAASPAPSPRSAYTAEVATLNPTPGAARDLDGQRLPDRDPGRPSASPDRVRPVRARARSGPSAVRQPTTRKQVLGIRQFSGGQFVVAGAVTARCQARGGVVRHRDGVALLRERPGLPAIGYFVLTETADGGTDEAGHRRRARRVLQDRRAQGMAGRLGGAARPARPATSSGTPCPGSAARPPQFGLSRRAPISSRRKCGAGWCARRIWQRSGPTTMC